MARLASHSGHIKIPPRVVVRAACRPIGPAVVERSSGPRRPIAISINNISNINNILAAAAKASSSGRRSIPISRTRPTASRGKVNRASQGSRDSMVAATAIARRSSTGQCVVVGSTATQTMAISKATGDTPTSVICARRVIVARPRRPRRMPNRPSVVDH